MTRYKRQTFCTSVLNVVQLFAVNAELCYNTN